MIIDAHQHLWNKDRVEYPWLIPEYGPIYRNFEADDIEPLLLEAGVDKTVLVQAADADTEYMLNVARERAWVGGVVGWVPLNDPIAAAKKLDIYTLNPVFKGVRHLINEEADPDWIISSEVLEGLGILAAFGMTFDMVAEYPKHIHHVHTLMEKVPNLHLVIDHLAKPPIKDRQISTWEQSLREVAEYDNVYAKLSGLGCEADHDSWSAEDI